MHSSNSYQYATFLEPACIHIQSHCEADISVCVSTLPGTPDFLSKSQTLRGLAKGEYTCIRAIVSFESVKE